METARIHVSGFTAQVMSRQPLVAGTVGMPVEFTFGEDWQALRKTAVFRCDGVTYTVLELEDTAVIPWELLRKPGCTLYAGVYGSSEDGSVQTPTLWAELGKIQEGADPSGTESAEPALPLWQQILDRTEKKLDKPETTPEAGAVLKINSVHEDGSFACEWAELPSDSWRLIADMEIAEEVSAVLLTEDSSGMAFALRDVLFIVHTPACPDHSNLCGYVNIFHGREASANSKYGAIIMASQTEDTYWTAKVSVIAGAPMYAEYSNAVGIGIAKAIGRSISFGSQLNTTDAVMKLGYQMNNCIPAGTKIQIWGVDA